MGEANKILPGHELLVRLREALGIPYHVRRISLDVCAGEVPKLIVESFVRDDLSNDISRCLQEFDVRVKSIQEVQIPME